MTGITRQLADFASDLSYDKVPADVASRTKLLILDTAGIMVRARHDAESTPSLVSAVERLGLAKGECSVLGDVKGYAASAAALVNGAMAHSLDFDDTHAEASLHSSAPIVPAVLAAAEMTGASGKDVLTAYVAGFETESRIARAVNFHHYEKGWHPTTTLGIFGTVAASALLLGLSEDELHSELARGCSRMSFNQSVWNFARIQRAEGRNLALVTGNADIFREVIVPSHGLDREFDSIVTS